jgi:hypothetical protein
LYDVIVMSEIPTKRNQPDTGKSEISHEASARIRIDVPLGTSYQEIRESIIHQAWELAGTQLRAAVALGITPETVSRMLRRTEKPRGNRITGPLAAKGSCGVSPTPGAWTANGTASFRSTMDSEQPGKASGASPQADDRAIDLGSRSREPQALAEENGRFFGPADYPGEADRLNGLLARQCNGRETLLPTPRESTPRPASPSDRQAFADRDNLPSPGAAFITDDSEEGSASESNNNGSGGDDWE